MAHTTRNFRQCLSSRFHLMKETVLETDLSFARSEDHKCLYFIQKCNQSESKRRQDSRSTVDFMHFQSRDGRGPM